MSTAGTRCARWTISSACSARFADDKEGNTARAVPLGYNLWTRAGQLRGLAAYFRSIGVPLDRATLAQWAHRSTFEDDFHGRVKGLDAPSDESLLMRQGIDTVKPDVHVRRFAESAAGRPLGDSEVIEVVSRAAKRLGIEGLRAGLAHLGGIPGVK